MKKIYHCNFPNCNYKTFEKSLIENHHIVPKELGGNDNDYNLINLCPNHHKLIYIPDCNFGNHSILHQNSIVITNIYKSTNGKVLEYYNVCNPNKFNLQSII